MNVKTWIPLILAVALGLVALLVARKALRPGGGGGPAAPTTGLVVAKHEVPVGQELTAADLAVDKVAADKMPARSFGNPQELVGRTVTTTLLKGQAVLDTLLAPAGSGAGVMGLVPPGMRAITIEINEFSGLGGMLVPNSWVDVISTVRDDKAQQGVSRTILQNIRVLATGRNLAPVPTAEGQPAPPPTNNVTLLVTPKQAQTLQLASQGGRPWLVLRSLRDAEEGRVNGTTMAEMRGDPEPAGDPFGAGQRAGVPVLMNGQPTTVPSSQPADPSPRFWVMRVIRGGVPTEVTLPIEPPSRTVSEATPPSIAPLTPELVPTAPRAPEAPLEQAVTPPAPGRATPDLGRDRTDDDRPTQGQAVVPPGSPTPVEGKAVTGTDEELK